MMAAAVFHYFRHAIDYFDAFQPLARYYACCAAMLLGAMRMPLMMLLPLLLSPLRHAMLTL